MDTHFLAVLLPQLRKIMRVESYQGCLLVETGPSVFPVLWIFSLPFPENKLVETTDTNLWGLNGFKMSGQFYTHLWNGVGDVRTGLPEALKETIPVPQILE